MACWLAGFPVPTHAAQLPQNALVQGGGALNRVVEASDLGRVGAYSRSRGTRLFLRSRDSGIGANAGVASPSRRLVSSTDEAGYYRSIGL